MCKEIACGGGVTNPLARLALQILIVDAMIVIRASVTSTWGLVTTLIRITGTTNAAVREPCITTTISTRMVTKTTIIPATATKVRTIDVGVKVHVIGCVGG